MQLNDIINVDRIKIGINVQSKKRALEKEEAIGECFGVGAARATNLEYGAKIIAEKTGKGWSDVRMPNYWAWECDYSKARILLGFNPKYSFEDSIESYIAMKNGEDIGVIPE